VCPEFGDTPSALNSAVSFDGGRFADERLDIKHKLGSIAMANTGEANSNGCLDPEPCTLNPEPRTLNPEP